MDSALPIDPLPENLPAGAPQVALAAFLRAALAAPNGLALRVALADATREIGWLEEAEAGYRAALATDPGLAQASRGLALLRAATPAARAAEAAALHAAGDYPAAAAAWDRLLAAHPGDLTATMGRGHALRAGGDPAAALADFARAFAVAPHEVWSGMSLADTRRELGQDADAVPVYRAVLADHPDHLPALLGLAHALRATGDLAAAAAAFRAALDRAPGAAEVLSGLAALDLAQGRLAEAEAGYRAALEAAPGEVAALMGLGYALAARGDAAGALPCFAAASAAAPRATWARLALADTHRALGRLPEAVAGYRALLADHPDDRQARLALAAAQRDLGEFDAAAEAARAILAADPAALPAWLSLGWTERLAGRHAAALDAFRHAAEIDPASPDPLVEAAVEERALGRPAVAGGLLRAALERDPAHVPALERMGEQHRMADDLPAALASFRAAIAAPRPSSWSFLGAAELALELGEDAAAWATLAEAATRLGPRPEILAKEIELLRRSGDIVAALARARAAPPGAFATWFERVLLEHLAGDTATADALLLAPPAVTVADRARVELLHGLVAADRWRLPEAVAALSRAVALAPDETWPRSRLAMAQMLTLETAGARAQLQGIIRAEASAAQLQGRVSRVSQTFHGQVLDEFVLDAATLAALQALQALPPAERIDPLLELAVQLPEHTPTALMVLVALRQAGVFARPPAGAGQPIPRILTQFWDTPEVPGDLERLMASWDATGPGFVRRRFDDAGARDYLARLGRPQLIEAYRRLDRPAPKADLFRLVVLAVSGGWYADADDRLIGDLAAAAPPGAGLVLYQEDMGSIGNNLIGAVPRHPIVTRALDLAVQAVLRGDNDSVWLATGPGLLSRAFVQALAWDDAGWEQAMADVVVHDHVTIQRIVAMHCLVGYKSTSRHWQRQAKSEARRAQGGARD